MIRKIALGGAFLGTACISEKGRDNVVPQEVVQLTTPEDKASVPAPPEVIRLTPSEEKDLIKIREWTTLKQPLTAAERDYLREPGPVPPSGSTKEAVLALGYVKLALTRGVGPSIEQYGREYRVPLVDVFRSNSHVAGVESARMVLEAMQKIPVSEEFYRKMLESLRFQSASWPKEAPQMDTLIPSIPPAVGIPFAPSNPLKEQERQIDGKTPTVSGSLDHSDQRLLDDAQVLADQGLFSQAILRVDQVSTQSPLRFIAVQKLREYSQNGIQDLRRKAAQSFQNANVAPDEQTRLEYLKGARQLLEDALMMFPDAPQATIVRENLKSLTQQIRDYRSR